MTQEDKSAKTSLPTSEGPIINSGGEQVTAETPPYEGIRQTGGPGETGPGYGQTEGHLAFNAEKADVDYGGREPSAEEASGVHPADPTPTPQQQHGVGESGPTEYGGGDFTDLGTKGESDRPVGAASPEQSSGVGAQPTKEDDMPQMPAGDQGG